MSPVFISVTSVHGQHIRHDLSLQELFSLGLYLFFIKLSFKSLIPKGLFRTAVGTEAVLAIRPGRPRPTQTHAWPTQTKFCPTCTTPVGLLKICLAL